MNLTEVKKSLERQFARQLSQGSVRNIVFWYDEEGVFAGDIDSLALEGVKIIKLYDNNMFAVKLYIEETDTTCNLLVYSPLPRPANRENWLTDTIKYSQTFSADETSLNLLSFKIDSALRHVVDRYKLFFRNSERCKRFEGYHLAPYTEAKIDAGVLSALCKLPAPNLDNVVRTLLIELANGESTVYDSIAKFGNMDVFWSLIQKSYGYNFPEQSLEKLAILLLCTHLAYSINGNLPKGWQNYISANSNCLVVIPVIRFKSDKNLPRSMGAKKVSLGLTNLSRKITSVIIHLTFFQNEPVGEKLLPLRVTAYFADEAGNRISNENIIIAESTSDKPDERTYKEKFTLKDMPYDKSKKYYLVLKDEDEIVNSEYLRMPFIIDLVFGGSIQF